ncbi:MAG TPA: restriction endonuclease subunit S [Povalibacter sp.]|uniref:restriction endonuclease subunit S n=1 Tax=Povalibacter sp. TaxID=1962978 RepID=UPI002B55822C|nr:restriction endonuclease subunit S [Povalibacter sp.]HMN44236.1 restriction endonuclease subunit S [Povalibacter sp.]
MTDASFEDFANNSSGFRQSNPPPSGWRSVKLREVSSCTLGGTPPTGIPKYWGGSIPWMASGDVNLRRVYDVPGRITEAGLAISNATLTSPPAVAVGLAGQGKTRGTVALTLCALSTNQSIALLRGDESSLLTGYLFHNLDRRYEELRARSSGGGRGGLSKEILESIPIDLPPSGEQRLITQIIDTLDTAIRQTEAIIEKLKQVKQGLLHDLLTCGIDENGELRPPQSEAPHLYKPSRLGWIPKEWDVSGLQSRASPERSVIRTGPFGSTLKGEHWRQVGRPVITIGSLGDRKFIEGELLYISEEKARSLADFEVHIGDIVFSRVADVGRSVVVGAAEVGWIMSSNFMRISIDLMKARPEYVQLVLSSDHRLRRQTRAHVNSGGRDVANSAILLGLLLGWPLSDEQDEVLRRVASLNIEVDEEVRRFEKLNSVKIGLMDDLLTGRVRVTPLLKD